MVRAAQGSTATITGRSSPSSARTASTPARNYSTVWPKATTRSARWPNMPATTSTTTERRPIAFVAPPDGLPATPTCAGVVSKAPHPEAAQAVHGLAAVAARPGGLPEQPVSDLRLDPQGRAADARRRATAAISSCCGPTTCRTTSPASPAFNSEWNGDARPVSAMSGARRARPSPSPARRRRRRRAPRPPPVVLYPVYYLLQAAFDVGDPDVASAHRLWPR